jgi:hypothetical protein
LKDNLHTDSYTNTTWAKSALLEDTQMHLDDIRSEINIIQGQSAIQYSWEESEVSKIDNVSFPIMAHSLSTDLEAYGLNHSVNLFSSNQLGSSRGSGSQRLGSSRGSESQRECTSGDSNSIIIDNLLDSPSFHQPENSVMGQDVNINSQTAY